ncbi:hypothetical protein DIX60_01825 [Streptococcus iniae]|uniref:DUF5592 family protein n=1 Tax=Streptococcus iniae TaxID=1346 RepID=UPI000EF72CB9|nr:DUF5592 family protein [Streptococcus iniae]RLV28409.1 hypothetical protein DIX60_01825 [Streptococcus iniae]
MNEKYGVPRDIYAKVKIIGLFISDIVLIGGSALIAITIAPKVFPTELWIQMFAFIILTPLITLFLVLPNNGGKRNWQSMYLYFRRKRRRFISINTRFGGRN